MLNISAEELKVIRHWSENAATSPFPQETALLNRIRRTPASRGLILNRKELQVIMHWADQETTGRYGTERYLLEQEHKLLEKIESYMNNEE